MPIIPWGEWLPDLAPFGNQGATTATNVRPAADGYLSFPALQANTGALTARCRGHVTVKDNDANVFNYAGDATNLYVLNVNTWDDVSGATYTNSATDNWEFAKFGETLYATNLADNVQSVSLGAVGNTFGDASGSPPKAKLITVIRDFLVLANVDASGTLVPERVHWSGINNPATWAVSATTQADVQDIPSGGPIYGIVGGEYGIVLQQFAVQRMTYVGSPVIFQFDEVLPGIGMFAPRCWVQIGNLLYFIAQDGFRVMENGSSSQKIAHDKVDRFFFDDVDNENLDRISATVDVVNNYIYWSYPGQGNTGGLANRILVYDYANNRWSLVNEEVEFLTRAATSGYSMDALDSFELGAELVTNGAFAADTDWTKGTGWTIGSGVATKAAGTASDLEQSISITAGLAYYLSYDAPTLSAGTVTPKIGGTSGTARSTTGTGITETIIAGSADTKIVFSSDSSHAGTIDNVSVKRATSIDALMDSLDSRVWTGGEATHAAFTSANKLGFFSGSAKAATLETNEFQLSPGRRSMLKRLRPITDGSSVTVTAQIGGRNKQTEAFSFSSGSLAEQSSGVIPCRKNARYHRIQVNMSGEFDRTMGVEAEGGPTGRR